MGPRQLDARIDPERVQPQLVPYCVERHVVLARYVFLFNLCSTCVTFEQSGTKSQVKF